MHLSIVRIPGNGAPLYDYLRVVSQESSHQPPVPVHSDESALFPIHPHGIPLLLLWKVLHSASVLRRFMDSDVVGMISGHIYYYLSDILPKIAKVRGWKRTTFIEAPRFLYTIVRDHDV